MEPLSYQEELPVPPFSPTISSLHLNVYGLCTSFLSSAIIAFWTSPKIAKLSSEYNTLITPHRGAFIIWSVIYVGELGFCASLVLVDALDALSIPVDFFFPHETLNSLCIMLSVAFVEQILWTVAFPKKIFLVSTVSLAVSCQHLRKAVELVDYSIVNNWTTKVSLTISYYLYLIIYILLSLKIHKAFVIFIFNYL